MAKIILAGGSGLTGSLTAQYLIDAGHELHMLGRREFSREFTDAPDYAHCHVADTDKWGDIIAQVQADVAISCLGTTIKKAGSKEAFRAIDYMLVRDFAQAAKDAGAGHFISISSTLANNEATNFYLKTKGEAENALRSAKFDRLDIIRPGLLKGDRGEFRLGEGIGILLSPVLDVMLHGSLRRYRSINAKLVAKSIATLVVETDHKPTFTIDNSNIYENDAIIAVANNRG